LGAGFALALFLNTSLAQAQYFISPRGSDANDCLSVATPCATMQHVAGLPNVGIQGTWVKLADGTYFQTLDLYHYRSLTITGNCANLRAVTVTANPNQILFHAEDHATLLLHCIRINTGGGDSRGISARQFSLVDYGNIVWDYFATGIHVAATEQSKINCVSKEYIQGSFGYHWLTSGLSAIESGCVTTFSVPVTAFALVVGAQLGLINFHGSIVNPENFGGAKYRLDGLSLGIGVNNLPGSAGQSFNGSIIE
jgi:hypothetical protein